MIRMEYHSQWDATAKLARGDCLIVCVAMVANWRGIEATSDGLLIKAGLPVGKLTYTFNQGIVAAQSVGLKLVYKRPATWEVIRDELIAGRPVITLLRYGELSGNQDDGDFAHFVVVVGCNHKAVYIHDPNFYAPYRDRGAYRWVAISEFETAIGTPLLETGNMALQSLFLG